MNVPKIVRYKTALKNGETRSFKDWAAADLDRLRKARQARKETA